VFVVVVVVYFLIDSVRKLLDTTSYDAVCGLAQLYAELTRLITQQDERVGIRDVVIATYRVPLVPVPGQPASFASSLCRSLPDFKRTAASLMRHFEVYKIKNRNHLLWTVPLHFSAFIFIFTARVVLTIQVQIFWIMTPW
jgi:hypothetical protein